MKISIIENKIKAIKDEVKEFHPLLKNLFNHLPSITHVESTHGNREYGADFVLTRYDEELGNEIHVGIVAKVGKIKQGDSDVERQIKECFTMQRVVKGNRKVLINEVWVMCRGNISQNAKDWYGEQDYPNIHFYDDSRICKLVETHMPEYAADIEIGESTYLAKTLESIESVRSNAAFSISSLDGYEIEQALTKVTSDNYNKSEGFGKKRSKYNIYSLINKKSVTLLDGSMGSGKSTLLQNSVAHYCSSELYSQEKKLPILVDFSDVRDRELTIDGIIDETLVDNDISHDASRKYLLFVDGWDEVRMPVDERIQLVDKLALEANDRDDVKLLLAGREIKEYQISGEHNSICETYRIEPMSLTSLIRLIENVCKGLNVSSRVAEDLKKSQLFKMLPKTPIAALLLTRLLKENSDELPSNLTELYSKYTELVLGRWDMDKGLTGQKEYDICTKVCGEIAVFILDNDLHQISLDEAKQFFYVYLDARNINIDREELVNSFFSRNELLIIDDEKGTFSFRHRTFAEFYYAKQKIQTGMEISERSFDFYWSTTYFFWVGLLRDCPDVLEEMARVEPSEVRNRFLKSLNFGSLMMAAYQTPYATIEGNIEQVFKESGQLYRDICSGHVESNFQNLSEMHITALFRYVLADAYGYRYFKEALGNAMVRIEDSDLDEDVKASALFFMNLAYLDSGGDDIFNSMLEKVGDQIPLSIQMAIRHEAKSNKIETSKPLAKLHRSVKKLVSDKSVKDQIAKMYDRPIKDLRVS